jgi:uncharacterized protein YjbJ (UPF0337 family)
VRHHVIFRDPDNIQLEIFFDPAVHPKCACRARVGSEYGLAGSARCKEASTMRMVNKVKNRYAMTAGRAKANYGRATGSRPKQLKGRWQRIAAAGRQVGEQVIDSCKNIRAALK